MKNINAKMQEIRDSIKRDKANLAKLREHKPRLDAMCYLAHSVIQPDVCPKGTKSWDFEPVVEMEGYISMWRDTPSMDVTANIKVSSFKHDPRLLAMFQCAKAAGLTYDRHDEQAEYSRVRYYYTLGSGLNLTINARLADGATACRREEIGRKMVTREEIQYKLVCD